MKSRTIVIAGRALALLFALAGLLFGARALYAQVDAGSILGTVTDASGAVISGATVTLTNEGTAASLSTTTGSDGLYKFSPVKIGSYKIDVVLQGFQPMTAKGVVVNVGANVVQDFALKPGSVSQTVEVTAAAPLMESQSAAVGQVVDSRSVNDLPLNGRNFTFLAQIAAGVNTPQADTRGNAASGAFAANGLRPAQNNYLLDGIDNNSDTVDFLNGTNYIVLPPVDAIQEFKVQTSDFSAEFGRSGAAILNATIKSGTNDFHGTLWEFFRNDVLDAADFFENAGNIKKGALQQNQFGVAAGGPVVIPHVFNGRNKLFIFGDYEGFRRVQGHNFDWLCADGCRARERFHEFPGSHYRTIDRQARDRHPGPHSSVGHHRGSRHDPGTQCRASGPGHRLDCSLDRLCSRSVRGFWHRGMPREHNQFRRRQHRRLPVKSDTGGTVGPQRHQPHETLPTPDHRFAVFKLRDFSKAL